MAPEPEDDHAAARLHRAVQQSKQARVIVEKRLGTTSHRAEALNARIFAPLRIRNHIDPVQITAAILWVSRAAALLRPNRRHRMIALQPPFSFDADAVHAKEAERLQAVHSISPENAVGGPYGGGIVLGQKVPACRREPDVAVDRGTATYAALRLAISPVRPHGDPPLTWLHQSIEVEL